MIFDFLKKDKESENLEFLAQISYVAKETRFKTSVIICTILEGEINKKDTVVIADINKKEIAQGIISSINYQRKSVDNIKKSDDDSNDIGLEFRNIYDKPIENAKFILKKKA